MHPLTRRSYSLAGRAAERASKFRQGHIGVAVVFARRHHVGAVVVGAGPAGIATVGTLLETLPRYAGRIVWIDPKFDAGKIARYSEVPSNTKAGLFLDYAHAVEPFRAICASAKHRPNPVTTIADMPQHETCSLSYAGDMLRFLTRGLHQHERVEPRLGYLKTTNWDAASPTLRLAYQPAQKLLAAEEGSLASPMVVFCTGSSPRTIALPSNPPLLPLETALTPSLLGATLDRTRNLQVGVIGSSHSAVLVLMNLARLAQSTHPHLRVRWFSRSPTFKYAEQRDGWTLYDNTGLKGIAAHFARAELEGDRLATSDAGKVVQRIDCGGSAEAEKQALGAWAPRCDYVVQAIGFDADPVPVDNSVKLVFDHETGAFGDSTGMPVRGLFGAGIAFPERTTDPVGNTEHAVGFWKFMRFLKRVVPQWVEDVYHVEEPRRQAGGVST